jgi:hypothetical protein
MSRGRRKRAAGELVSPGNRRLRRLLGVGLLGVGLLVSATGSGAAGGPQEAVDGDDASGEAAGFMSFCVRTPDR